MRHKKWKCLLQNSMLVGAWIAGLTLAGCRGDSIASPELISAPAAKDSPEAMFARVVAMGFPRDLIKDVGDMYVIDGDIIVTKNSLVLNGVAQDQSVLHPPQRPTFQYVANYYPGLSTSTLSDGLIYTPMIGVDLSAIEADNTEWATAIRGAISNWVSIPGAQVTFVEGGPNTYTYTLTVVRGPCDSNAGTIACGTFPTQQCTYTGCYVVPGNQIQITSNYDTLSAAEKLFTITHEMGHIVGFRHTNWNNRLCGNFPNYFACSEAEQPVGAIHIPGTPTSSLGGPQGDPQSVMNATVLPWNGFTLYDRIATRYLFPGGPGPAPALSSDETPRLDWSPQQDAVAYEVWYVQPHGCGSVICFGWDPKPPDTETYVSTTTETFYVDNSRTRTSVCTAPDYVTPAAAYRIKAVFPDNGVKSNLGPYTSCW